MRTGRAVWLLLVGAALLVAGVYAVAGGGLAAIVAGVVLIVVGLFADFDATPDPAADAFPDRPDLPVELRGMAGGDPW